jgi:hypothetical protein
MNCVPELSSTHKTSNDTLSSLKSWIIKMVPFVWSRTVNHNYKESSAFYININLILSWNTRLDLISLFLWGFSNPNLRLWHYALWFVAVQNSFWNYESDRHFVGLLRQGIVPSQGLYLQKTFPDNTEKRRHTTTPEVGLEPAVQDGTRLRPGRNGDQLNQPKRKMFHAYYMPCPLMLHVITILVSYI